MPSALPLPKPSEGAVEVTLGKHFSVGPTGLTVHGQPKFEQWAQLGHALRVMEQGIQFAIGDFLRYGEEKFGEQASQIIDAEEWTESTVRVYRWVAQQVPFENRRSDLSFSHHQAVASLSSAEQRHWLRLAADGGRGEGQWPVTRLKAAIRTGADIAPTGWFLLVACEDEADLVALRKQLELDGRSVKPLISRRRLVAV